MFWPDESTLIVADLHLAKGSGYAARGIHLPPYDTRVTLDRLAGLVRTHAPRRVICLGDSFHDDEAADRLHGDDTARLRRLTDGREWVWIAGNHDPHPPARFGGEVAAELALGHLTFRHEATRAAPPGEISGHFHPSASCHVRGRRVSDRCFVADGRRAILPAFGAYTGGLDVLDPAISELFRDGFDVWILGDRRVHRLPASRLTARERGV